VTDEGWSRPAFYVTDQAIMQPPDQDIAWGVTTYVGPRRYRPDPADGRVGAAPAEVDGFGGPDRPDADAPPADDNRSLLASSRTMAIGSLVSRITGFLRTLAIAAALGAAGVGDAFNGANTFPNMVYELLLGGVLTSVIVPLLVNAQEHDKDRGVAYTQRLMSLATVALAVTTLVAVAAAPLIAHAFVSDPAKRDLTSTFATLLLPEIFFYGLAGMFVAVLNVKHVFAPGAWAPVVNNVVAIITVGLFLLVPGPPTLLPSNMTTAQILVLGIGTTLGIAGQAAVLLPALRRTGFRWRWRLRAEPDERGRMKEAGSLTAWVLGYVVASQIGVVVIIKVAFGLSDGAVTNFTFADLLFQVPYGVLGVSLLTALMPRMSRAAARGDTGAVVADLSLGARLSAVALVPVTAGLIILGPSLTTALFIGRMKIDEAHLVGTSLAWSAFGLLPFAIVMLQLRVFYAMRDARTPTLVNVCMVLAKIVLVLLAGQILSGDAQVIALNVSTSLSYLVGAIVGHVLLTRRFGRLGFMAVARTVLRVTAAAVIGGAMAWVGVSVAHLAAGSGRVGSLLALVLGGLLGLLTFFAAGRALRIHELREILAAVRRRPAAERAAETPAGRESRGP
jgi:putative peptidoglycan lipid II flippase